MSLNVVELPVVDLNDIPDMLELLGESIRTGDEGDVRSLALVFESSDGLQLRMFGRLDMLAAIGMFHAAAHMATGLMLDEGD